LIQIGLLPLCTAVHVVAKCTKRVCEGDYYTVTELKKIVRS